MIVLIAGLLASLPNLATASPILGSRAVTSLDQTAFAEAQQRDNTATRAFSGTQIKTSDGRCLFVDELSGDFRANLTPIQIANCGGTDGQGWDVITSGKHNNVANSMLIVSTLTEACFNFDPRRAAGNQVLLFSCGGRADGGGAVTNSQLFPFNGTAGPQTLSPENQPGSCLTAAGSVVDISPCAAGNANQLFTFEGKVSNSITTAPTASATVSSTASTGASADASLCAAAPASITQTTTTAASLSSVVVSITAQTQVVGAAATAIPNPTAAVSVSRAGGVLQPSAVAEAQPRDDTATRAFTSVSIKAPNGQCLFIDPTAGDFRENLVPVSLVTCGGTPNEKFDFITAGKHNNAAGSSLIVSSLTNGCISLDDRRAAGDTVTLFSCGGRADGGGETNTGQLIPFTGGTSFVFAPESDQNKTCVVPGDGRLSSAPCTNDGSQVFTIVQ